MQKNYVLYQPINYYICFITISIIFYFDQPNQFSFFENHIVFQNRSPQEYKIYYYNQYNNNNQIIKMKKK